jgi:hypothetical protein
MGYLRKYYEVHEGETGILSLHDLLERYGQNLLDNTVIAPADCTPAQYETVARLRQSIAERDSKAYERLERSIEHWLGDKNASLAVKNIATYVVGFTDYHLQQTRFVAVKRLCPREQIIRDIGDDTAVRNALEDYLVKKVPGYFGTMSRDEIRRLPDAEIISGAVKRLDENAFFSAVMVVKGSRIYIDQMPVNLRKINREFLRGHDLVLLKNRFPAECHEILIKAMTCIHTPDPDEMARDIGMLSLRDSVSLLLLALKDLLTLPFTAKAYDWSLDEPRLEVNEATGSVIQSLDSTESLLSAA